MSEHTPDRRKGPKLPTHCPSGHALTLENTYLYRRRRRTSGTTYERRLCRTCRNGAVYTWWQQYRREHGEEYRAYHREWQANQRWRRKLLDALTVEPTMIDLPGLQ